MIINKMTALISVLILCMACNKSDQISNQVSPPLKIIFDTDMGSDCDDVGALALLHQYANQGKVEIIGCIYSSGKVPYGAAVIEAINRYYQRPEIPVGANHQDEVGDPVDKMTAEKFARDTAAYGHQIVHNHDAIEQTRLNRQLLAAAGDHSVTYVTVGHTKGLYDLLVSQPDDISDLSGAVLIEKKLQRWVALGALKANNPEGKYTKDWNFFFNGTAPYTQNLVENFPVAVYYVDAGHQVMTGQSLNSTPVGNIVRTTYRDWLWNVQEKTLDDQRPSWDLAAVYFAIEGVGDFLRNTGSGWLEFDTEKGCKWHSGERHLTQYYIRQKEASNQAFADYLNQMIAMPPIN